MADLAAAERLVEIGSTRGWCEQAAEVLREALAPRGVACWSTPAAARAEVDECLTEGWLCLGLANADELLGWVGLRPLYEHTWELQPLVVRPSAQGRGVGRRLLAHLERHAAARGIGAILLGADDEGGETSLSGVPAATFDLCEQLRVLRSLKRHPFVFYQRCGYRIVGIVPDSGTGYADIWLWKPLV
ncbi:GNAT family N-acetyltransferase [Marichromatium bheemlicum]|uniref:GNAT family N-acetyltransferase n=1 Tax=Marichromatium bheemlicum TaxID=365339 RepID=A0ABX1IDQ2_9GAMM|nr:GNAT family N-acetyltransferase [Marichromatium bheemlicum]NKN34302.1 GNAT family N-acetyltransferase [Marichromatium bheemlicum]